MSGRTIFLVTSHASSCFELQDTLVGLGDSTLITNQKGDSLLRQAVKEAPEIVVVDLHLCDEPSQTVHLMEQIHVALPESYMVMWCEDALQAGEYGKAVFDIGGLCITTELSNPVLPVYLLQLEKLLSPQERGVWITRENGELVFNLWHPGRTISLVCEDAESSTGFYSDEQLTIPASIIVEKIKMNPDIVSVSCGKHSIGVKVCEDADVALVQKVILHDLVCAYALRPFKPPQYHWLK